MIKPRLVKKKFRECEFSSKSGKTTVLNLIFKYKEERVEIFIKDIQDKDNKKYIKTIIEDCRHQATNHFKNQESALLDIKEAKEVKDIIN